MNFKRFHESKNLFDKDNQAMYFNHTSLGYGGSWIALSAGILGIVLRIPCSPSTTYAISLRGEYTQSIWNIELTSSDSTPTENNPVATNTITNTKPVNLTTVFTTLANTKYILLQLSSVYINSGGTDNIMLNTGSQPLPYEPYSSEVWHDIPHYIHNTSTDTITTPADIYANDTTATVGLKGQMEQSGTPTPTTPIQPQECGERTGNLAHNNREKGYYLDTTTGLPVTASSTTFKYWCFMTPIAKVEVGDKFILNIDIPNNINFWFQYSVINNGVMQARSSGNGSKIAVTLQNSGDLYISCYSYNANESLIDEAMKTIMINFGSSVLPYEPYGYKIPISSANTTTPIYLGEVKTTRQIRKLVFDGSEPWVLSSNIIYINNTDTERLSPLICTHFPNVQNTGMWNGNNWIFQVNISNLGMTGRDAWITYLQQQYANGTPVTVWYVLATETTGIVNEPLMKIGDYSDSLSTTIPCTAGENTLDVQTTVQPSEVTATYKGWHPVADVHVYPDSSWMPTSWEEFRKAVRSGKAQSLYPVGTKLYENWGDTTSDAWIVVDYPTGEDYLDSDLAQQGYTNRVMLMEEKLNYLRQFDAIEAWLYVETAIPAGTYRFTIPNYDASYGGNKTYIFTSTANVPVGSQLTLTWVYQQNPSAVQAYSSATSTSALFNVSITEWDGTTACTDLGTIKLAQNDPDSTYGKLNHIHRARYGSNNYYQSGYRQWLNTNASANWWTPTNVFDRPYGNRTNAGRLNVMNSNMKSVLATPTVNCITNNLFEYPSLDGTTFSLQTAYTVTDKLFPVTHSEINLSSSPNVNSVVDYYVGKGNADRIKYRKDNGNAYYWWLRTPNPTNACYVRHVYTSGALSSFYASLTFGSAAACIIQ